MKPEQPHHQAGNPSQSIFAPKANRYVSTGRSGRVPRNWAVPTRVEIAPIALIVKAAIGPGESRTRAGGEGEGGGEEHALKDWGWLSIAHPSGGLWIPYLWRQERLFPLHLGPPSGAEKVHQLCLQKEADGRRNCLGLQLPFPTPAWDMRPSLQPSNKSTRNL